MKVEYFMEKSWLKFEKLTLNKYYRRNKAYQKYNNTLG